MNVDFSPEAIKERYHRFGEILQYVLTNMEETILQAKNDQLSALNHRKLVDVFVPYRSIEKANFNKENIRRSILQYNIEYDENTVIRMNLPISQWK